MPVKRHLVIKPLNLLRNIYRYNVKRKFTPLPPTEAQINITWQCNSRCRMCNIWRIKPKNEMTVDEWRRILTDPIFLSLERVIVAGGEPTIHPNFVELVNLFVDSMPRLEKLVLITNGFLPAQVHVNQIRSILEFTRKRGIDLTVDVSLDGVGGMHQKIRGIPQAFRRTSQTILAIKALQAEFDFHISVGTIILPQNLRKLREVEDWCKCHHIPHSFQLVGFNEDYFRNFNKRSEMDYRREDLPLLIDLMKNLAKKKEGGLLGGLLKKHSYYWSDMVNFYQHGGFRTTPCSFASDAFSLDSFGNVYYCHFTRPIGNCRNGKSIRDIYFDKNNLKYREEMTRTVCLRCNNDCTSQWAVPKDFKKLAWFRLTGRLGNPGPR